VNLKEANEKNDLILSKKRDFEMEKDAKVFHCCDLYGGKTRNQFIRLLSFYNSYKLLHFI